MNEKSKMIANKVAHQSKSAFLNAFDIVKLNFKSLIRSKMFPIMVAIFFAMVLIATFVFVPFNWGVGLFYIAYLQLPCLILMGWMTYNVMDSVIYKNIRSSGIGSVSFFIAQLATILIIGNILSLIFWPIVWLMAHFGLFITSWADKQYQVSTVFNPFNNFTWILIFYCVELTTVVTFSFYFIIQFWVTNIKVYYLIVVPTIILTIIFGGVINDYFSQAIGYSGSYEQWINNNATENIDYIYNDGTYYMTESCYEQMINEVGNLEILKIQHDLFPIWMFPIALLYPFYGVGQFATTAIAFNSTWGIINSNSQEISVNVVESLDNIDSSSILNSIQLSSVSDFDIKWYDWFTVAPFNGSGSWTWWLVLIQPYAIIITYISIGVTSDIVQKII